MEIVSLFHNRRSPPVCISRTGITSQDCHTFLRGNNTHHAKVTTLIGWTTPRPGAQDGDITDRNVQKGHQDAHRNGNDRMDEREDHLAQRYLTIGEIPWFTR